jgi:hypothetical protein
MIAKIYGYYSVDNEKVNRHRKKLQELISLNGPTQFINNINPPGIVFSVPNTYSESSNIKRYESYSEKHDNERFSACFPNCPKKIDVPIEPETGSGYIDAHDNFVAQHGTYIDTFDLTDEINAIEVE